MWIVFCLLIFHNGMIVNSMELKGTNSCQNPLMVTSNTKIWCPSLSDEEPYLLLSLSNLTYITRLNIKSIAYYHLEYTRDNFIDENTIWRSYNLLDNKQETIQFDPPMIAKHIRLNIQQIKTNLCIQFEFFGCIFTDGVVSYSMLQGYNQFEDDTYDGEYTEKNWLLNGLGQLSDGQTGSDNPNGLQWVGWRKSRFGKHNHSIGILFTFDTLRNFSRMTIHANNYYLNKIYVFRSIIIEFLNIKNSSFITYHHQHDDQFEMARPIMIDLKNHIASQIKIRLFFDGNWILISEVTFDSVIVPNNFIIKSQPRQFLLYIIMCVSIIGIILLFPILIILIRRIKKSDIKSNHNHTNSSASTTSSQVDVGSSHHPYATIQPYNENNSSPHYTKLIPTPNIFRTSSIHIEGICGNSAYGTERLFTFDLNQNQFISSQNINIKQRIDNKHQIINGGEIYQGELQVNQSLIPITIRRLLPNASVQTKLSFFNEISLLTSLCHPNIVHAYGLCSEPTISLLTESSDLSKIDLYQYLQHYKQDQPTDNTLTLFFARQISSALAYLESLNIYHRDIAARNCLVSYDLNIKLHDLSMCNEIYADDYVLITIDNDIQTRRPIRWCSWETVCLNQFTSKSDVFSFGILLWELLTMGERPHRLLNDEQVLFNLQNSVHYLIIPSNAEDLTDLILSCWNKYDYDRPSFYQINHLLYQKQQLLTIKSDNYQQIA